MTKAVGSPVMAQRGWPSRVAARWFVVTLACGSIAAVHAAPVATALDRPALASAHAARAMLLGATNAGARIVAVGERGIVVLSDDRGVTWRQAPTPVSVTLTAVRFADESNGIAVGHEGVVLTTSDAGDTWKRSLDGRVVARVALDAAAATTDDARIDAARRLVSEGADKPLFDVVVFDARRALVIGAFGLALGTEDGGKTWSTWDDRLDNRTGLHLYAVRCLGDSMLIVGEQGIVLLSRDRGRSFSRVSVPYKGSFFAGELLSDRELVVAGLEANVWRSDDAGATWSRVPLPVASSVTGSARGADGSLLLVNQAGFLLAQRGAAFNVVNRTPQPSINAVLPLDAGRYVVMTSQGAALIDGGGVKP